MSAAGKRRARGFTLIEMLVVLAITGLVAGLAFPSVERMLKRQDFESASRTLDLTLRQARATAILTGAPVRFAPATPPADVRLALPAQAIVFYADGTSTGGSVTLSAADRSRRIDVDAATGLIGNPK